eukprot:CAMPEP_0178909336 /NCGR_PEP_ID=MMETSP0786-20121207/8451_1 /TAXON_ID=186022 /ORGANISM="Thalassionema frauenfeldii, Strain CCMP 1798" /LENGTH=131 /DNA_ID=CAMNT_0020581397 /DNA_START=120 /DNA_END=515 /DNA_ORIENTATION=+
MSNTDDTNNNAEENPSSTLPDLSKSKFINVASMNEKRLSPACVAINTNQFLMMGGRDGSRRFSSCEMYDRTSNQWTSLSCNLPKALYSCGAAFVNGKVYLAGGYDTNSGEFSNDVFVLDTSTTSRFKMAKF